MAIRSLRTRLLLGLLVPVVVFGAGAAHLVRTLRANARALAAVRAGEEASRESLVLASYAREQYNHVAHVLLLPSEVESEHLHHLSCAEDGFDGAMAHLQRYVAGDPEARGALDRLNETATRFRRLFVEEILPAHHQGDRALALARHVESERLLGEMAAAADGLAARFRKEVEATQRAAHLEGERATRAGLFAIGLACLLALGAAGWLWAAISRPLEALVHAIARLGAGERGLALPLADGRDELAQVARCLQDMAARLDAHERELIQKERGAAIGRLAAGIAHQLNNPLGVLVGTVKIAQDERYSPEKRREALLVLDAEVLELRSTLANLIALVRPGVGAIERVEVAPLIDQALDKARRYARAQGAVEVALALDEGLALETDAPKLEQALVNLLANAMEAMPEGGRVEVSARRVGADVEIDIADGGPGIPAEIAERIFDPYVTTKRAGTGLGLALARALALALGGSLTLGPARPDEGARFRLVLPSVPPPELRAAAVAPTREPAALLAEARS